MPLPQQIGFDAPTPADRAYVDLARCFWGARPATPTGQRSRANFRPPAAAGLRPAEPTEPELARWLHLRRGVAKFLAVLVLSVTRPDDRDRPPGQVNGATVAIMNGGSAQAAGAAGRPEASVAVETPRQAQLPRKFRGTGSPS